MPKVVDPDAIGVGEAACGFGFSLKAFGYAFVLHQVLMEDFDSDLSIDWLLGGAIHTPHGALANQLIDAKFVHEDASEEGIGFVTLSGREHHPTLLTKGDVFGVGMFAFGADLHNKNLVFLYGVRAVWDVPV